MKTQEVVEKSRRGFMLMATRSGVGHLFQLASTLCLAYFLAPRDYGVFGVLNGWIGGLLLFTDIGLGEALVRKKEPPSDEELSSYFAIRLFLGLATFLFLWLFIPSILNFYEITGVDSSLLRWCGIILVLDTLIGVPKILLQREIEFDGVAKVELFSVLCLYCIQISMAYFGMGYWSFFIALFVRGIIQALGLHYISPKIIFPKFYKGALKGSYRYGIISQLNSMIPATSAILVPLILKNFLTLDEMGLVFWASGLVQAPLMFIFNYVEVFLPSLSHLQDRFEELQFVASRSIENMLLGIGFIFGAGGTLSAALVPLLFHEKWVPAIPLFPFAALSLFFYSIRFLNVSVAMAIGKPELRMKTEIFSLLTEFLLVSLGCLYFKAEGYFLARSLTFFLSVLLSGLYIKKYLRKNVYIRLFTVSFASLGGYFLTRILKIEEELILSSITFCLCYFSLCLMLDRESRSDLSKVISKLPLANKIRKSNG